jgi:hypothetical protein
MATIAEARTQKPTGPLNDLLLFHLVAAILNLLAWWLRDLEKADAETMAELIERLVLTPVGDLRNGPPKGL